MGITGNSGCGQTTAAGFAKEFCRGVCSLDRIGHRLLKKDYVVREVALGFGRDDFTRMSSSELRSELGKLVFGNNDDLVTLNSIIHHRMVGWARNSAEVLRPRPGIWLLEGALIYELGLDALLDTVVVVRDTAERCFERTAERDGVTGRTVMRRWNGQLDLEDKVSMADYVLKNSGGLDYLKRQVITIFGSIEKDMSS